MKKALAFVLVALMVASMALGMTACKKDDGKYTIGICQLVTHDALDAATKGFKDALIAELGEDKVAFVHKDAAGKLDNCNTIIDGFVSDEVDLILANATSPLQAAAGKTNKIPVLGTSVTDYASALGIKEWTGTVGTNVSGTSDLAPLDQQAAMIKELFPDAKTVGLLFCSGETNSVYQVTEMEKYLAELGYTTKRFSFVDANDVQNVTQLACDGADVLYVPTDNTAANCKDAIGNVVLAAKKPLVAGESGICSGCGVATLSIDYYALGQTTGKMAAKILKGEADISKMPIEKAPEATKQYNKTICDALGIKIPEGYSPLS